MARFLKNKYTKWYFALVNNAQHRSITGYVEKHHIVPKSLGGDDSASNLVVLSAREHFVAHLLLTKMVDDKHLTAKLKHAVGKFIQNSPVQNRTFTSWEYKKIRENISLARTGKKHSEETRKKMSDKRKGTAPWNKGITGIIHSAESNIKRSETLKGIKRSQEFCEKLSNAKLGHTAGMTGKQHSEETRIKMSENMKGARGPQQRIEVCLHCSTKNVTHRHIKFCKKT
jgi:hypothetical protein